MHSRLANIRFPGFEILAQEVPHKGGRTFGYRATDGDSSIAYIPDYSLANSTEEPSDLVSKVDLLLHEAQHTADEMDTKSFLGHSTVELALELAERHDVSRLALFHHDPTRTDDQIDAIVDALTASPVSVLAAAAGATFHLSQSNKDRRIPGVRVRVRSGPGR